jgi:Transmembrane domain of unknown function (DUF3566)
MADRRADESPLAPHRSLSGPAHAADTNGDTGKRPLSERVSAAVSGASSAVKSAAAPSSGRPASASTAGRSGSRTTPASSPSRSSTSGRTATTGAAATKAAARPRGTRRARLRLVHVDPWSIMKTAFLLSIAFGIVLVVAVAVVWSVLGAAGVWTSINTTVADVMGGQSASTFDIRNYVGTSRVLGFTMIVAVVDVVLITAISTLGAFLYNLAAALLGGVEVTLAEDDR